MGKGQASSMGWPRNRGGGQGSPPIGGPTVSVLCCCGIHNGGRAGVRPQAQAAAGAGRGTCWESGELGSLGAEYDTGVSR